MQPTRFVLAALALALVACNSDNIHPSLGPCDLVLVSARVEPASLTMTVGQSQRLKAQRVVAAEGCTEELFDGNFAWYTSNGSVAIVDSMGTVTAVAPGQASITASTERYTVESASATVQVVSPP